MTAKEEAFHREMLAIYDNVRKHVRGYTPSYFRKKVINSGGVTAAKHWLAKKGVSNGFKRLARESKLVFSMEALVMKSEYAELFSDDEINIAQKRLEKYGWRSERGRIEDSDIVDTKYWIFQAVPSRDDLKEILRPGTTDHWLATHFRKMMRPGNKVIFWQAGSESGIYGVGELRGTPYLDDNKEWRVKTKYTKRFDPPLLKRDLLRHPILRTLRILKAPFQGTNFEATKEQWNALVFLNDTFNAGEVETPECFAEGATVSRSVNAYERNPLARQKCLEHYGYRCAACKTDFQAKYGEIGKACIHVHHLKQLSTIGQEYQVDPLKDLRPVCPNCHAMIHWEDPMMSIERLQKMLKR